MGAVHIAKREAEAEPAHFYSAMPYYQHTPYAAAYKPITYAAAYKPVSYFKPMHMQAKTYSNDAMKPMGYAGKGMYHAESAGAVHIAKREAEAEAEPQFYNSFYGNHAFTYGAYPYTHYPYTTA